MFDHDEDDFWDDMMIMEMMDEDEKLKADCGDDGEDGQSYHSRRQTQSSAGCYVATCVFGSYDCPEVWTLRRFRDHCLSQSAAGQQFIKVYYILSPKLVSWFGSSWFFQCPVKKALSVFVQTLKKRGYMDTPYQDRNYS